jgi:hypothetical protein
MKCLVSLTLVGGAAAFQRLAFVPRQQPLLPTTSASTVLWASSSLLDDDLIRAVECATKFNLCNLDELERLAVKLENMEECLFETKGELCDKEMHDRKDVAEVLRLQSELRLRMEYMESANLFSADVTKEHDIQEREKALQILAEDAM